MNTLLIILLILCIVDLYKNKKILSPSFLFNLVFFITLSLYEWHLSNIQQTISTKTEMLLLCCVVSFNLTYILMKKYYDNSKLKTLLDKLETKLFNKTSIAKKIKIAKYISIVIFIIELIYSRGCPLIWKFTGDARTYFEFGIPSLNGAFYGLIICLGAYSLFSKSKDKYIYIIMGILMISRQVILSIFIEGIVYYLLSSKNKINYKKIFLLIVIGFAGFSIVGNFRSGSSAMNNLFRPNAQYKNLPTSIKWVYSYVTFSISNLNNLVNMTDGGVNHGASMLLDFLPTVVAKKVKIEPSYRPYFLISPNFNVSTYLPNIYLDFGITGVIVFNAIISLFGYILYVFTSSKSERSMLLYSVFVHNIILLFFTNMFLHPPIMVQLLYIIIIFGGSKKEIEKKSIINDEKKVSVVIPTYNRAGTIKRSIMSVLKQTYKNIEVIVVDDCSTDNTDEIVRKIKDDRVKYYKLKKNSGACVARNFGIEHSHGDFIAFQDSDDEWYDNKLEIQMNELLNSDCDLVFCSLSRIKEGKKTGKIVPKKLIDCSNNFTKQLLMENCISTQTILARKYVFNEEKFDPTLPRFQDWDLMIRISKKYKIKHVDIPLLNLYIQSDSITKNPKKALTALNIIYDKNKKEIEKDAKIVYSFNVKEANFLFENQDDCKNQLKKILKQKFNIKIFIYYMSCLTRTNKLILKLKKII